MAMMEQVKAVVTRGLGITTKNATGEMVEAPSPYETGEVGVNSPWSASPIDDAPGLYPRMSALRMYERMIRNDAQVRASLRACKIPVQGAEWYVEPASNSDLDIDVADFVTYNLFENYMSTPWSGVLANALRMFEFGSSVFEIVWEYDSYTPPKANRNTMRKLMVRKLAYRPPSTIVKFLYDSHGGPVGVRHRAVDPSEAGMGQSREVDIPVSKLLIFPYDQLGGNMEGQSILRTAYKHWYYKEQFYKIDGVQKERHGLGVPKINLPPGYSQNDLDLARQLGSNFRTNERAFMIVPPGWEMDFTKLEGNMVNALESAQHHDLMIARNVLVQFINTGTGSGSSGGQSGARASSATMYDLFLKSLRHVGNQIADVLNVHLIPQLVDYNYTVKRYPKLCVRRVGDVRDMQAWTASIRNLVLADVISVDTDTEAWVRKEMEMPQNVDYDDDRINLSLLKPFVTVDDEGKPIAGANAGQGIIIGPNGKPLMSRTQPNDPGSTDGASGRPPTGNVPKGASQGARY
ncbi:MAG TPA: hypothetical protein VF077_05725 [Nitrospiraceae bacterium]